MPGSRSEMIYTESRSEIIYSVSGSGSIFGKKFRMRPDPPPLLLTLILPSLPSERIDKCLNTVYREKREDVKQR
jgi:hypothetical protein